MEGTSTTAWVAALTARLAAELDDAALAAALVGRWGDDMCGQFAAAVPLGDVATSALFDLSAPTVEPSHIDALVVYAFGNRVTPDGVSLPGPVNEQLAECVRRVVAQRPVSVYAQWEVADLLVGTPDVTSIGMQVDEHGRVTYLSTAGVAEQVAARAPGNRVGVIAFADHAVRCVMTSQAAGLMAAVPAQVALPHEYDPDSGQPWTRTRLDYLAIDLPARLAVWPART